MLRDMSKMQILMFVLMFADWVYTCSADKREDEFKVYWNVPTYLCKIRNASLDFEPYLKNFSIIHNFNDSFQGENMLIMYDPGNFPIMKWDHNESQLVAHNGGFPQNGSIEDHLLKFEEFINKTIKNETFSGVAVIDFEVWRPIFRQNWNNQTIYRNMSIERVENNATFKDDPKINETMKRKEAEKQFEESAKEFMEKTLKKAKEMRKNAKWGYYGFPYCLNWKNETSGTNNYTCPTLVQKENNRTMWLFNESVALFPSVYMKENLTDEEHKGYVEGRLNETWRLIEQMNTTKPYVYPYIWFRYLNTNNYLNETKMKSTLEAASKYEKGGAIIWGSSSDVGNDSNCTKLLNYLNSTLGPIVKKVKEQWKNYTSQEKKE